jgi:drug/metabolite transporter (DMT)-like permease
MVLLGVAGTGLAYVWNAAIVTRWGAINASTVTYLTPLAGVLLGVLVLGERATWNQPLGALLVVGGALVAQGRLQRSPGVGGRALSPAAGAVPGRSGTG